MPSRTRLWPSTCPGGGKPPSQTWKTFLGSHVGCLASIDLCVVPTATFPVRYLFIVLLHQRRQVVHFDLTDQHSAAWASQLLREAFPFEMAPHYLIRDRDSIYGAEVPRTLEGMGVEELVIAPRSPWQSPFVERFIGSPRRECLDHVIVLNERHLHRIVSEYLRHYHRARAPLSLGRNAPLPRDVEPAANGRVVSEPMVGGLHHCYRRAARTAASSLPYSRNFRKANCRKSASPRNDGTLLALVAASEPSRTVR